MSTALAREHFENMIRFGLTLAFLAAVGCGGDPAVTTNPMTMGGTGVPAAGAGAAGTAAMPGAGTTGTAGTTAAGVGASGSVAVAGSSAAGMGAAGTVAAGTGAAGMAAAGTGAAGTGAAGGGAPAGPATFSAVYEAVWGASSTGRCVFCHGMGPTDGTNGNLGMVMNKEAFYAATVNMPAKGSMCMGKGMYIVPGSPETSLLLQKLKDPPPCGSVMPVGGMLSDEDIKLLTDWIMAGAKMD
jgi:hypothetical protein